MAIPNLGDVLTYNGSAWVNQPWVQGPFGIGTSTPGAQIDLGVSAPGQNTPANYLIGYGANTGWPVNLAGIYDASYVDQYILLNGKLSGMRAAPTATGSNGGGSFLRHSCGTTPYMGLDLGMYSSGSAQTLNTYLSIRGTGNVGVGTTSPGSVLQVAGAIATAIANKTSAYTLAASDSVITADATGGAFTVTLPTAASIAGRAYTVKKIDSSANAVTVGTTSSQTIDGATTYALSSRYQFLTVVSDGANWQIVAK